MNLVAIRSRAERCEAARDAGAGTVGAYGWAAAAIESAADVPALLAEIDRLRHEVFTLTNSEDAQVFIVEQERDVFAAAIARVVAGLDPSDFTTADDMFTAVKKALRTPGAEQ